MTFTPDPSISEVLGLLREENLTWISEEVEEAIAAGKPETFMMRQSRSNGKLNFELGQRISPGDASVPIEKTRIRLLPFSTEEQAEILARTLETYTIGIAEVIDTLSIRASEMQPRSTASDVNLTLMNDVTNEEFDLSGHKKDTIQEILKSIRRLLSDLTTPSEQEA